MKCPRCPGGTALKAEMYEDIEIDRCPSCGGTWLDQDELWAIVEIRDQKRPPTLVADVISASFSGVPATEHSTLERCPKCSEIMSPMNYNYSSGIVVEKCPAGHGIWLDRQELEKVQAHAEHWDSESEKNKDEWKALLRKVEAEAKAAPAKRAGIVEMQKPSEYLTRRIFWKLSKLPRILRRF